MPKLRPKELARLRKYVQSIMFSAEQAQDRLDGNTDVGYLIDLLGDIRMDLESAEEIACKDTEL